jgi:predicted MFS family arabinose efflux permease
MTDTQISLILSIGGASDIAGKLLSGLILDIKAVRGKRVVIYSILHVTIALSILLTGTVAEDFVSLAICWSMMILFINVAFAQLPVVLADIVGKTDFSAALGLSRLSQGIFVFVGIRIAGRQFQGCLENYVYDIVQNIFAWRILFRCYTNTAYFEPKLPNVKYKIIILSNISAV